MVLSKIYQCGSKNDLPLKFNIYYSKKTPSVTEMKGNISNSIKLDDNLSVSTYMIIKGLYKTLILKY